MADEPSMQQEFIRRLNETIAANLNNEGFGVDELALEMGLSHSTLLRKLKQVTRKSANHYIREARLERAMELLRKNVAPASEIAYRVGFSSPAYFNRCFHQHFGYPPGEVKKKNPITEVNSISEPKVNDFWLKPLKFPLFKNPVRRFILLTSLVPAVLFILFYLVYSSFFLKNAKNGVYNRNKLEKSIVVLPFSHQGSDSLMETTLLEITGNITENLSRIKDLMVISGNTVEHLRGQKMNAARRIANRLGANFRLEGLTQKTDSRVVLTVRLISTHTEKQIYSEQFRLSSADEFLLCNDISLKVADRLNAIVTPLEREIINKKPTRSNEALFYYAAGKALHKHISERLSTDLAGDARNAINCFERALTYDSAYANAYAGLASIYNVLIKYDSALFITEKALFFDSRNADAHFHRGLAFNRTGKTIDAEACFKNAMKYDPNNSLYYYYLGGLYYGLGEYSKGMEYLLGSYKLNGALFSDPEFIEVRRLEWDYLHLFRSLYDLGYYEEGNKYAAIWLKLADEDIGGYIYNQIWAHMINCKFEEAYKIGKQDFKNKEKIIFYPWPKDMGINLLFLERYDEALDFLRDYKEQLKNRPGAKIMDHLIGFACLKTGRIEEAENLFCSAIENANEFIELKPQFMKEKYYTFDHFSRWPYFILTCTYAVRGETKKAIEALDLLRKSNPQSDLDALTFLKHFPMLKNIRNEPEFIAFLNERESIFGEERKKVEELLREEGIIDQ